LNNGNFIAKPNTDILKFIINNLKSSCNYLDPKINCINKTTGPVIFNQIIKQYLNLKKENKSKIKILNPEYLEPCTQNICDITNNTFIIHKHSSTWINGFLKNLISFYLDNRIKLNYLLIILIFVLFIFIINKIKKKI
jgi:mannosyltransferase OCH1-like enzyme